MKRHYTAAAITAGLFFAIVGNAQSTTFNFQQAIDNSYTGSITLDGNVLSNPTHEKGGSTLIWLKDGITLTATSSNNVYLDYGGAGLGVCKSLTSGKQCTPSNDDNVTVNEWLHFNFDSQVNIDIGQSLFKDTDHFTYNPIPSGIWLKVDGSSTYDLGTTTASIFTGTDFEFWTASDATQFYVSSLEASPVPEPMTLILFGAGLAGLAGPGLRKARRR